MFSIIVPIYNSELYLKDCLSSFDRQTFDDFELILVDDGSTDSSAMICSDYVSGHGNTHLIHQDNAGQNAARFTGLSHSRGDYVLFVDSDDCIRRDCLWQLDDVIRKTDVDVVCFDYQEGTGATYTSTCCNAKYLSPGFYNDMGLSGAYSALCSGDCNSLWNKAYKRPIIYSALNDLREYDFLRHGEDLFALISVVDTAESFYYLPECLYFYRKNNLSITSEFSKNDIRDLKLVFSRLIEASKKWGDECPMLSNVAALKHLYWALLSVSTSDLKVCDQVRYANLIANTMDTICDIDLREVKSNLRFDFSIPVQLLLNGNFRLALMWAKFICMVMDVVG